MAVSLKKQTPIIREITPVHLIDEEDTIVKPVRSEPASKPETLKIEVVGEKQLPKIIEADSREKSEKIGKYSGLSRSDLIEVIVKTVLACALVAALVLFFCQMSSDFSGTVNSISYQEAVIKEVYDGIIVDKKIENPRSNLFRTTNTEYRLYVNVEYELDGEKKTAKKYFSVPESTYLAYDIGDYFNSHNFSFSDEQ